MNVYVLVQSVDGDQSQVGVYGTLERAQDAAASGTENPLAWKTQRGGWYAADGIEDAVYGTSNYFEVTEWEVL